jgi:hypothetical protein
VDACSEKALSPGRCATRSSGPFHPNPEFFSRFCPKSPSTNSWAHFTKRKRTRAILNANSAPPQNVARYECFIPRPSHHEPYLFMTTPVTSGERNRLVPRMPTGVMTRCGTRATVINPMIAPQTPIPSAANPGVKARSAGFFLMALQLEVKKNSPESWKPTSSSNWKSNSSRTAMTGLPAGFPCHDWRSIS